MTYISSMPSGHGGASFSLVHSVNVQSASAKVSKGNKATMQNSTTSAVIFLGFNNASVMADLSRETRNVLGIDKAGF